MKKTLLALAALALPASAQAATNIVTNGSFELGTDPGVFTDLVAGSTNITGWTIGGSSIDYIGSYWQAADGVRSIDLSGSTSKNGSFAGSLSQLLNTTAGTTYNVTFSLAGNPDGSPLTKIVLSSAMDGGFTQLYTNTFTVVPGVNTRANMGWQTFGFQFTANSATTMLNFQSGVNTAFGAALDNVSVAAVPEPATWALMIFGFGAVGMAARRRSAVRQVLA